MRDIDRRETIEVKVETEARVGELKSILERVWYISPDHLLFHRDVELSEEKSLGFYGLERHDLLVVCRDRKSDTSLRGNFPEDQERISRGKSWLKRNIGLDPDGLELSEYIHSNGGSTEIVFEQNDSRYQLKVSEERIKEYDIKKEGE